MTWSDFFALIFLIVVLFGCGAFLWWLDKPERVLRVKRLEAELNFFQSAGYVFNHIACDIEGFDRLRLMIEDYCRTGACFYELAAVEIEESLKTEDQ